MKAVRCWNEEASLPEGVALIDGKEYPKSLRYYNFFS